MMSALDKIKAIQQKAEEEITALRKEAASELARKIADAKATLKALELEYEEVTGKPVRAVEVPEATTGRKRARKLNSAQIEKLSEQIKTTIKGYGKGGAKIGEIITSLKQDGIQAANTQITKLIKETKGISKTGERAATVYFIK